MIEGDFQVIVSNKKQEESIKIDVRQDFRFAKTSIELQAVNLTNACKLAGEAELRYIKSDAKMSRSKMALLDTTI